MPGRRPLGAKERRKQVERRRGVYIARHVGDRVYERLQALGSVTRNHVYRIMAGAIFNPRGSPLLLHPKLPKSQQQVGLPVYHGGQQDVLFGYLALGEDTKDDYDVAVKTFLLPNHFQIRDAARGPMPDWYVRFLKKRILNQPKP